MPEPLLILDDIHASYVKKEILRGVSLEVHPGEVVALLGGNGSGKSTTLKVIAGLLPPSKGRIIFKGKDITQATAHQRHKMGIGYLPQGGRVFPNLTVAENLQIARAHAATGSHASSPRETADAPFSELTSRAHVRAGLLSGGQRQMLAVAMVRAQRPALALLDEPSGALSKDLVLAVFEGLHAYVQLTSSGVLLVEQNINEASKQSNRTLRLEIGVATPFKNQLAR